MSAARPPEGARAAAEGGGWPVSAARPPEGARAAAEGGGRLLPAAADSALAGTRRRLMLRARMIASAVDASDLPSPCVSVCRMDDALGLCAGCLRSIDEIAGWSRADDALRRVIWQRVAARAACTSSTPATSPPAP
jgi:predicted Fe-S protein YdhL (DUF1289 family)